MFVCPASELLRRYQTEGDAFLTTVVTRDKSWVHFYQPEAKRTKDSATFFRRNPKNFLRNSRAQVMKF